MSSFGTPQHQRIYSAAVEFEWDEANEEHIARHGVTPEEAEEALTDPRRIGAPAYNTESKQLRHMKTINSWDEMPNFADEEEEAEFWATHDTGKALLDQMQPVPLDGGGELPPARSTSSYSRTRPVSVRLDEDVLRRLKAVAAKKRKGYQSLLKEFLVERLYEEEKREGLIA